MFRLMTSDPNPLKYKGNYLNTSFDIWKTEFLYTVELGYNVIKDTEYFVSL
jgi:hypothetical protein